MHRLIWPPYSQTQHWTEQTVNIISDRVYNENLVVIKNTCSKTVFMVNKKLIKKIN